LFNERVGKRVATYSISMGVLYLLFGLLEVLNGAGVDGWAGVYETLYVPADLIGGIILLFIAAVYLAGISQQRRGDREGLSFLVVGVLLSTVFFGLYVVIMGANGLGYLLRFEDWLEWIWLDDLRPEIWLFPLLLPGVYMAMKKEWRE
jgi:hypothetical protein